MTPALPIVFGDKNEGGGPKGLGAICVGVRTFDQHASWIEVLIRSLLAQHVTSPHKNYLDLLLFLTDTESSPSSPFNRFLVDTVDRVNRDFGRDQVFLVSDKFSPPRKFPNALYGYDETDALVSFLLTLPQCRWLMMTNGDNMYNKAWFDAVAPIVVSASKTPNSAAARAEVVDLIGWDFATHHPRKNGRQQIISIQLARKFVDLGSILVRASLYSHLQVQFLPDGLFTRDLFARDFHLIMRILRYIRESRKQHLPVTDSSSTALVPGNGLSEAKVAGKKTNMGSSDEQEPGTYLLHRLLMFHQ